MEDISIWYFIKFWYIIIGLIHFFVYAVKAFQQHRYNEPVELLIVTFAWPMVDILLLTRLGKETKENISQNICLKCGHEMEIRRIVCKSSRRLVKRTHVSTPNEV